jgi:hypothetical protein
MTRRSLLFALGLAAALTASQARAASITSLYSTGVDAAHVLLPALTLDPHYIMAAGSSDGQTGVRPFTVPDGGFPIPPWAANTSTARWITPRDFEAVNGPYNYETHFTLNPGDNPLTAEIHGRISADDEVIGVVLNGVLVVPPVLTPDGAPGWSVLHPFSIPTGNAFVLGDNTLVFLTLNNHFVVTGLIVDMTGTVQSIPEPASLALLGIGLSGLFAFRRFFKRASLA